MASKNTVKMSRDIVADALNQMMNALKAGKESVSVKKNSKLLISVLAIAKLKEYVKSYSANKNEVLIEFAKLNACKAIKPRYNVNKSNIDKYFRRYLPSVDMGIIIISTNKGLITHHEAFEKNIVIVSPSTLLATLRTIASIWRQENQNKNAVEIARQSGALYDKFQGLITDLIELGKRITTLQRVYEESMKKLYLGRGNLISSVERIKKLGANAMRSLPQQLLDRADDNEDVDDEAEQSGR